MTKACAPKWQRVQLVCLEVVAFRLFSVAHTNTYTLSHRQRAKPENDDNCISLSNGLMFICNLAAHICSCVWVCVVNLDKWEVIVSMTPMIAFKVILLVFRWMVLVLDVYHFDLDHLPYCMMAVCVCVCSVLNWLVVMCIRQTRMFMGWLEAMAKVSIIRLDAWLVMCNR